MYSGCVCGWWLASVYYFPVEYIRDCSIWLQGTALKYIYSGVVYGALLITHKPLYRYHQKRKKKITLLTVLSLITRQSYHIQLKEPLAQSTSLTILPPTKTLLPFPHPPLTKSSPYSYLPLFLSPSLPLSLSPSLPLSLSPPLPLTPYLASPQPQSPTCATHLQHERKPA